MGLEFVEIVMEIEERFGIKFPDDAFENCQTYGDLVDITVHVVHEQLVETTDTRRELDEWLQDLLITRYLVKPVHIVPDADLFGPELNLG